MKRICKQLVGVATILALIIGSFAPLKVSAHYLDEKGRSWYTVSELLDYKKEVDRETEQKCGDDAYCREELFYSRMESEDSKYQALSQLTQQQFVVTAVNPGAETMKVLFFGEDAMLKQMGISEELTLSELYIGWFDYEIERIFNYSSYPDSLLTDTMPGAHLLYGQRGADLYGKWNDEGPGEGIMVDQEVEIYAPGAELFSNTSGRIAYAAFAEPYFNAMGTFSYASCLLEEDYSEGTECRLMFSAEESQRYFPPRETVDTEDAVDSMAVNEVDNGDDVDSGNFGNNGNNVLEGIKGKDGVDIGGYYGNSSAKGAEEKSAGDGVIVKNGSNNDGPKAPNTGAQPCVTKSIEFPWWLGALIVIGNVAFLWVFWPKSPKKSKKVLDKKSRVR